MPTTLEPGDPPLLRKARGAFFTPPELCRYMADWAIRSGGERVLEPSCGEAAFLIAAARRIAELGGDADERLHAVELHEPSAAAARAALRAEDFDARIDVGDFFGLPSAAAYDAVIGNPPYVRYQDFAGTQRRLAREAALKAGVRLTALASSWAAFTVHAALFLRPAGRLALVLPAELLSTNYAGEVRGFLMRRFGRVRLVLFTERVFPGVLEEVVLLLAEGAGPTDHCELHQVRDVAELVRDVRPLTRWRPVEPRDKWTAAMVHPRALEVSRSALAGGGFAMLQEWGDTTLGAVTGSNGFFALSDAAVRERGLRGSDLVRLSPPGSRHLRCLALGGGDWERLRERGGRVWLFRPGREPSAAGRAYIAAGEAAGVHRAYKCRVRDPWWRTPLVPPPDLFLTYMNADTPRLSWNSAGVHHLNSVHGVYLREGASPAAARILPLATLNSLTLLGAETVGRAYGGGMLKLEPREADVLPVPAPALAGRLGDGLEALRPAVLAELTAGRLGGAVRLVDRVVLREGLGLPARDVRALRDAREALAARRHARSRARR